MYVFDLYLYVLYVSRWMLLPDTYKNTIEFVCVCMCMYCMYVYVFFNMYFAQNVQVPFLGKETLPKCSDPQVK